MFHRQMSINAKRLLVRYQQAIRAKRNMSSGGVPEAYKHLIRPNMNQGYPVPSQLYSEAYAARQTKYNIYLGVSLAFFVSAIGYVWSSETFDFLSPPPREVNIPLEHLKFPDDA